MLNDTAKQTSPSARRHAGLPRKASEQGAIAIMTAFVLVIMIAMFGLALDLSRSYNRKVELQSVADAVALAAAAALDGTPEGIDRAVSEAEQVASSYNLSYNNSERVSWSGAALTFGPSPDGGAGSWEGAEQAKATAVKMFFARVDTSALDPTHGKVKNFLIRVLSPALSETNVSASAVAGRDSLNVLPLAICANSNVKVKAPPTADELVEYGFRRGVGYDLMNLNPGGRTPENFLVSPVAPPGASGAAMKGRLDMVAPFVCTGKMAIPTLQGGQVTVEREFPIASLYQQLNARFGTYVTPCQSSTAPADPNLTLFNPASASQPASTGWMKDKPAGQVAAPLQAPDPLLTVAEKPDDATNEAYGVLWSYARAARYSSYVAKNGIEPAGGYATFNPADWAQLYTPGKPEAPSYPATTPYQTTGGASWYKSSRNTRVLRVPLLACPVPAGASSTATVLGIGKFFMTVPATSSAVYAEFAGMDTETALRGSPRLYR